MIKMNKTDEEKYEEFEKHNECILPITTSAHLRAYLRNAFLAGLKVGREEMLDPMVNNAFDFGKSCIQSEKEYWQFKVAELRNKIRLDWNVLIGCKSESSEWKRGVSVTMRRVLNEIDRIFKSSKESEENE